MEVTAHQITTSYQRIGRGPILVMLHGWGCDWQIFASVIPELSNHFQLLIPDLPAFGQSHTPTEVWDSHDYAKWLADFLAQTVGKKHFSLFGHSHGGKVAALYVAAGEGPQPARLVLCDSSGIPASLSLRKRVQQKVLKFIPSTLKQKLPAVLRQRLLKISGSATDHFYSTPAQKQILVKVVREDIRPSLSQIYLPTLILWGEDDLETPLSDSKQFNSLLPSSELSPFEGAGHFPFIDQPTHFVRELISFCIG